MANEIKALNIGGTTYDIKPEFADNAGKVNSPLKAGTKSYDGSAEVTITASDLGLSSALKYIGTSSTKVSDEGTESPTINGSVYSIPAGTSGQVVFYDKKEFVWNGSQWEFLGDDRNFKVIQSPVSDPVADSATSTTFIDAISQDANGLITATKKRLPSYLSTSGGEITGELNIDASATSDNPLYLRSNKKDSEGACRIYFADSTNAFQGYVMTGWGNLILAHRSRKQIGVGDNGIWCSTDNGTTRNTLIHSGNIGEYKAGDADNLGGLSASYYMTSIYSTNQDINQLPYTINRPYILRVGGSNPNLPNSMDYGNLVHFASAGADTAFQLMSSYKKDLLLYRRGEITTVFSNPWKTIAFTDSNVASATKLQTARTIWGQSFDGTGDITNPATMQYLFFANTGSDAVGYVGKGGTTNNTIYVANYTADGLVRLFTNNNTNNSLILNSSGNVTIGGSDLAGRDVKLFVEDTRETNGYLLNGKFLSPNLLAGGTSLIIFGKSESTNNRAYIGYTHNSDSSDSNAITFGFYGKDKIVNFLANGNVLIGNTHDNGGKLQVHGEINVTAANGGINFTNGLVTGNASAYLNVIGSSYAILQTSHYGVAYTCPLCLNPLGGNVLIGTTTDSGYKLDVNGTARINGNTTITGSCSASSGFFETSDSRLKDFKDPVKVDLDKLSKLTKAYFTFKNDPEKMHLGVSAQEIQEIYPEIVDENEEGFLSVDYAKLSVIALTAVDELNNRLNSIEERLSRLEK